MVFHSWVTLISVPQLSARPALHDNISQDATVISRLSLFCEFGGLQNLDHFKGFYSESTLLAMQSGVIAKAFLSVCLSVCPSIPGVLSAGMKIRSCGL